MARFGKIDPKLDLVQEELKVLKFWDKEQIFQQSLNARKQAKRYIFFEGPPTANGKPGIHHVLARAFKDLFPRYKTMQGFLVERKAGWDTHGLPVEIEVEKALGLKDKSDIEKYGVAKFNEQCKKSVWRYKADWEKLTRRMAFWLDMDNPYVTYDPKYIESLWWIIREVWNQGFLYEGYKVVPRCTRCGTALSSHEVAQGYKEIEENSVFLKFKIKAGKQVSRLAGKGDIYILSWTTTPWTLPGNVALAVNPKVEYAVVKLANSDEKLVVARDDVLMGRVFDGKAVNIITKMQGKELVGWEYEPLFPGAVPKTAENYKNAFKVYPANFVTTEEGTGVVHTAVMYGDDDYQLGEQVGLPKVHTVSEDGKFLPSVKKWAGEHVKDERVEREIVADLEKRGLLLREMPYKHDYPFCWRCDKPLLYYAAHSWFIKMSALRDKLLQNNRDINWVPEHLKEGRFGEWLREVKDWALSRERYWGTPLPLWKSEDGDLICIGSFDELAKLSKNKKKVGDDFDPHKPFIDEIVLEKDGKEYKRVPEVMDTWFDSGAMPFAQWYYPHANKSKIDKGEAYPADFISEAVDQTRGWFYTLLAVATLLDKGAPYKNVIVLGHVLDKHGKKMSKSSGNVVDPWKIFDQYGADVLRWYFYTISQPGLPKNFDEDGMKQVTRRFILTLWNTLSFFTTYANLDGFTPTSQMPKPSNALDKWMLARLDQVILVVTKSLEDYDVMNAAGRIEELVSDLSNWYVRRSRQRFWRSARHNSSNDGGEGEANKDKEQAYQTLHWVLKNISLLLAPFAPLIAEMLYQALKTDDGIASVHLADWPKAHKVDDKLISEMEVVRKIVELGHFLREAAKTKVRQPLSELRVKAKALPDELVGLITDELNVKRVKFEFGQDELDTKLTPELEMEGLAREMVRLVQSLRKDRGLAVSDRIKLFYDSQDKTVIQALNTFASYLQGEVLATELTRSQPNTDALVKINGREVAIGIKKI